MTTLVAKPTSASSFTGIQEAVLISGPSRGEIVKVRSDEEKAGEQISPEVALLLQQFAGAMREVAQEVAQILAISERISRRVDALEQDEPS
jgi:hypothetical protein